MGWLIKILERKGILATFSGLLISVPIILYFEMKIIMDSLDITLEQAKMIILFISVFAGIEIVFIMLPSKLKIKSKIIEIELED